MEIPCTQNRDFIIELYIMLIDDISAITVIAVKNCMKLPAIQMHIFNMTLKNHQ